MGRQLPKILSLDDIEDVEGFIAVVIDRHFPGIDAGEREEKIAEGLEIACVKFAALTTGVRLSERMRSLHLDLIDAWRKRTSRGKDSDTTTSDAIPEPAIDSTDEDTLKAAVEAIVRAPDDLSDPRVAGRLRGLLDSPTGRYMGVPSWRPPAPVARVEWLRARRDDGTEFDVK